jgi:hypothetical protein
MPASSARTVDGPDAGEYYPADSFARVVAMAEPFKVAISEILFRPTSREN